MELFLYNSLTKRKEKFIPINDGKVKMYVCGPTVYDYPHLGNALAVVIYDVLYRLLNHIYGAENVTYARNITDVDDKILIAAKTQNISINQLTEKITNIFNSNITDLNCLSPTFEPKATEHIAQMIMIIHKLLEENVAYIADDHVYFSVDKFSDYGALSRRKIEDLEAGSRVEVALSKKNPADFILWKPGELSEDGVFASPFGYGRPGWHIECSAMSYQYLGHDFDIHGGGVDLIFPHHTNEIAQSRCAFPGSTYAKYWVHNGFLTVNGEKMSKSLGNFITIDELLQKNISGEVIRYILLSSHYRKPIDWNEKALADAKKSLDSFYRVLEENNDYTSDIYFIDQEFCDDLLDDLNTPQAFARLHNLVNKYNKESSKEIKKQIANSIYNSGQLIGFFKQNPEEWFKKTNLDPIFIERQIELRLKAKESKNWNTADTIRQDLLNHGIVLEDKADGSCVWRRK